MKFNVYYLIAVISSCSFGVSMAAGAYGWAVYNIAVSAIAFYVGFKEEKQPANSAI